MQMINFILPVIFFLMAQKLYGKDKFMNHFQLVQLDLKLQLEVQFLSLN